MKIYGGSEGIAPHILDLGTRWKWVVSFTSQPLYSRGKSCGIHWTGGLVGPRASLDAVEQRKTLHFRESNPGLPAGSPSLYRLSYPDSPLNELTIYKVFLKIGHFFIHTDINTVLNKVLKHRASICSGDALNPRYLVRIPAFIDPGLIFLDLCRVRAGIATSIRPQILPSKSLPIHQSSDVVSCAYWQSRKRTDTIILENWILLWWDMV
jgi:hypothetical protein